MMPVLDVKDCWFRGRVTVHADLCGLTKTGLLQGLRVLADGVPTVGDPITVCDLFGTEEFRAVVVEVRPDMFLLDVDWDSGDA